MYATSQFNVTFDFFCPAGRTYTVLVGVWSPSFCWCVSHDGLELSSVLQGGCGDDEKELVVCLLPNVLLLLVVVGSFATHLGILYTSVPFSILLVVDRTDFSCCMYNLC